MTPEDGACREKSAPKITMFVHINLYEHIHDGSVVSTACAD
jgi:hypothetical protein